MNKGLSRQFDFSEKIKSENLSLSPSPSLCVSLFGVQAQFLNLLLCRCFQLSYLERNPEDAQDESLEGKKLTRIPSLLNQGFPLSVSALVSFRRAPFLGLFPGAKVRSYCLMSA